MATEDGWPEGYGATGGHGFWHIETYYRLWSVGSDAERVILTTDEPGARAFAEIMEERDAARAVAAEWRDMYAEETGTPKADVASVHLAALGGGLPGKLADGVHSQADELPPGWSVERKGIYGEAMAWSLVAASGRRIVAFASRGHAIREAWSMFGIPRDELAVMRRRCVACEYLTAGCPTCGDAAKVESNNDD